MIYLISKLLCVLIQYFLLKLTHLVSQFLLFIKSNLWRYSFMDWQTFFSTAIGGIAGSILTLFIAQKQFKRDDKSLRDKIRKDSIEQLEKLNYTLEQIKEIRLPLQQLENSREDGISDGLRVISYYDLAHSYFFKVLIVINDVPISYEEEKQLMSSSNKFRKQATQFRNSFDMFKDETKSNAKIFHRSKELLDACASELESSITVILDRHLGYGSHYYTSKNA